MPKLDLLTPVEVIEAAAQGWSLGRVYDLDTRRCSVMVLGMPSAEAAGRAVVAQARFNNPLAIKALSLVMASNQEK